MKGNIKKHILLACFLLGMVASLASLVASLRVPGGEGAAALGGYSWGRLGVAGVMALAGVSFLWLAIQTLRPPSAQKTLERIKAQVGKAWLFNGLFFIALNLVILGIAFSLFARHALEGALAGFMPLVAWLVTLGLLTLVLLALPTSGPTRYRAASWLLLPTLLIYGAATHIFIWGLAPVDRGDFPSYAAQWDIERIDMQQQDIFVLFNEGTALLNRENPYEKVLASESLRFNQEFATHFPIFYMLSWGAQAAGLQTFPVWLAFWRVIFLLFNLSIAALLFYVPHRQHGQTALAVFAAIFWLFNPWTLSLTMVSLIDFIPIFFMLLSIYWFPRKRTLALLCFSLSLGIKQIGIFLVPVYLVWTWQANEGRALKGFLADVLLIGGIPLLTSLPFLVWNAEGFIKSILVSATRAPETHFGAPSLDALIGLEGIPAKLPLLLMIALVALLAWQKRVPYYTAAFLVMLSFVDFNSVLFLQYMTWVAALLPPALNELIHARQVAHAAVA